MRKLLGLALVLSLVLTVVSCGNRGKVIAKVGSQKITLGQFDDNYRAPVPPQDSAAAMTNKKLLLDQMVEQKLLALEALARNLDKEPKLQKEYEDLTKNMLMGQLYRQEILDKSQPTDREIKDYYQRMGTEAKARHILVKTEEEAKAVYQSLKDGADFEETARQKSQDPGSASRGGDLGWFGWGRMVQAFQKAVFDLKPGQLGKPVQTPFGFHIIRMDSTRPAEIKPFDQMKDMIKQQLTASKPREMATEYVDKVKSSAKVKIKKDVLDMLAAKQPQTMGPAPLPPLGDETEKKKVIVTYSGGSWTVEVFYNKLNKMFGGNADLRNSAVLEQQVQAMLVEDLLLARAKSKNLQNNPKVKQQMEKAWDEMLAAAFYQAEVGPKVSVNPESVKVFYARNKKAFYQPAKAMVHQIVTRTKPEADAAYKLLSQGADFAATAAERSVDWTKSSGGALGEVAQNDPRFPEVSKAAFAAGLNQITRPFAVKDGFAVIKVSARTPGKQMSFDEVKASIEQNMAQGQEQILYLSLIEALKSKYPVTVDENVLKLAGQQKPEEEK
jgi:parvulin-like peptidyl-prolyl isomerase